MRIFGFPVQIRPGFALFMLLIIVINGVPMGPWLAGSVAGFTLLHELGHAFAARRCQLFPPCDATLHAGWISHIDLLELRREQNRIVRTDLRQCLHVPNVGPI